MEGFSYAQFVIPGLILMGVITNSFANTSSSLFISRYLGNIVDLLVTPISAPQFIFAYTLAAMLRGLLVGGAVLVISTFFADHALGASLCNFGHGGFSQLFCSLSSV